jgi:ABC-type transporter Mla maintaining outer membrane lipid asymmetry ATPase subunit MlaF
MADSIAFATKAFTVCNPLDKGDILLNSVNTYVKKGGVTAVLGASGSGKSLLLQAVTGETEPRILLI